MRERERERARREDVMNKIYMNERGREEKKRARDS